jgi:hypothetical protein
VGIAEVVELRALSEICKGFVEGVVVWGWGGLKVSSHQDWCVGMFGR